MKSSDASRALELYGEGKSVSEVARILGVSPYKAKKLQPQLAPKETPAEKAPDDERWELAIKVPLERAEEIFGKATDGEKLAAFRDLCDQDKMNCVMVILQARMDALLAPPTAPAAVTVPADEEKEVGQ